MPQSQDRHDEAVRVLRKVRDLLSDKRRWTAGQLAQDKFGESVQATEPRAVRFCAAGAIAKVVNELYMARSNGGIHSVLRESTRAGEVEQAATTLLIRALRTNPYHNTDIPHVNDGEDGYERIMAGLTRVVEDSPRRRAAIKGWATRRHNQWLREMEASSVDPRPEVMSFGGTIVVSPVAERKEVTV